MALGIHIGECSCVCAESDDVSTLWKIRLSDGAIVWRSRRRASDECVSVELFEDGGELYVIEGGQNGSQSGITKWRDDGNEHVRIWDSDQTDGSLSLPDNTAPFDSDFDQSTRAMPNRVAITADGAVWFVTRELGVDSLAIEYLTRLSGDNGVTLKSEQIQLSLSGSIYPWTIRRIYAGPPGEISTGATPGRIYIIWQGQRDASRSYEQLYMYNTLFQRFIAIPNVAINSSHATVIGNDYTQGIFSFQFESFSYDYREFNPVTGLVSSPLAAVSGAPALGNLHPLNIENSAANGYGVGLGRTVAGGLVDFNRIQVVKITPAPMAITQSVEFTVPQTLKPPRYPATAASSGIGYIAIGGKVYKIESGDVTLLKSFNDVGEGSVERIHYDSGQLLIVGGNLQDDDASYNQMYSLDASSGQVSWRVQLAENNIGTLHDIRVSNGFAYVVGSPM